VLTQLLQQGENEELEFKTSFGREAIETLVAFANAKGGRVLVGISNTGEAVGVSVSAVSPQQWINQVKAVTSPSVVPDIEIFKHQDKDIAMLWVPSYPVKPVSMKGKYFIRKHASNHLMSLEEIANEHLKTINLSWDFAVDPNHGVKDISLEKVNRFVELTNALRDHPITDDPLTVLRKFELTREQGITFGCFLMFCSMPTLSTTIDAGRFDSETIIKDSLTIRDDLFAEVETCLNFIRKHISKRFIVKGKAQRDEVWEYPLEAVREIVLNMIVH
jgi:ATP-dependent DNA helicase RecG